MVCGDSPVSARRWTRAEWKNIQAALLCVGVRSLRGVDLKHGAPFVCMQIMRLFLFLWAGDRFTRESALFVKWRGKRHAYRCLLHYGEMKIFQLCPSWKCYFNEEMMRFFFSHSGLLCSGAKSKQWSLLPQQRHLPSATSININSWNNKPKHRNRLVSLLFFFSLTVSLHHYIFFFFWETCHFMIITFA